MLATAAHRFLDLSHGALAGALDKSDGKRRGVMSGDVSLLLGLLHALPCYPKLLVGIVGHTKQKASALVVVQPHLPQIATLGMMDLVLIDIQRIILKVIPGQSDGRAVGYGRVICGLQDSDHQEVRGKFNQRLSEVECKHRYQMDKACHHQLTSKCDAVIPYSDLVKDHILFRLSRLRVLPPCLLHAGTERLVWIDFLLRHGPYGLIMHLGPFHINLVDICGDTGGGTGIYNIL